MAVTQSALVAGLTVSDTGGAGTGTLTVNTASGWTETIYSHRHDDAHRFGHGDLLRS